MKTLSLQSQLYRALVSVGHSSRLFSSVTSPGLNTSFTYIPTSDKPSPRNASSAAASISPDGCNFTASAGSLCSNGHHNKKFLHRRLSGQIVSHELDTGLQNGVGKENVDCGVIGAGVLGLAVAKQLAKLGREVVVVEAAEGIGTRTSSQNSKVIHDGIYYPPGSLKCIALVASIARVTILINQTGTNMDYTHKQLGLALSIVVMVQPFIGVIRPEGSLLRGRESRPCWSVIHCVLGTGALFLEIIN